MAEISTSHKKSVMDFDYILQELAVCFSKDQRTKTKITMDTMCIAGGAVRDNLLKRKPKDIDVFILDGLDFTPSDIRYILKRHFKNIDFKKIADFDSNYTNKFKICATFLMPKLNNPVDIQIITRAEKNIIDLVQDFDWNICQAVYLYGGNLYVNSDLWQLHHDIPDRLGDFELHFNKSDDNRKALKRGFEFETRYNVKINKNDLAKLCYLVACDEDPMMEMDFNNFPKVNIEQDLLSETKLFTKGLTGYEEIKYLQITGKKP